jgi:glutamate carboxypeptidase
VIDAVVAAARAAAADAPALLERWARQPSGSHDTPGLAAMRALVAARAGALPGALAEVPLAAGEPALRLRHRGDAPRRVLLVGHYDTVFTAEHPGPPVGRPSPDVLTGPGVADMKGGILVLLAALAGLEASPAAPGLGWEVLLTPDEELGAPRSLGVLRDAAQGADAALVFEPAADDGDVVVARRGREVLTLDVTGRAAHAGRDPWNGRSAVAALAELTLLAGRMSAHDRGVSVNVGLVSGGSAVNVVPASARGEIDVRADSAADLDAVREGLASAALRVGAERGVVAEVDRVLGCPPMARTPGADALAKAYAAGAASLGMRVAAVAVGGVSDANHLAATGIPVLDGLGVVGGGLHGPDEWASLPSIPERAAAAALLLHDLAFSSASAPERPDSGRGPF